MVGLTPDQVSKVCPVQYVEWIPSTVQNVFQLVHEQTKLAAKRQKSNKDVNSKENQFDTRSRVGMEMLSSCSRQKARIRVDRTFCSNKTCNKSCLYNSKRY